MNPKKFSKRWKVHLLFGGGFLLVLTVNVVINLWSGGTLSRSIVGALREIRPMEYIMLALFWYWFASDRQLNSRPTFTSLNLGGTKS